MYIPIHYSSQSLQNNVISGNYFLDTARKYGKVISIALVILGALSALVIIYRQIKAKKLASEETEISPYLSPLPVATPGKKEKHNEDIVEKTKEIACLPISDDVPDSLAYHSEEQIKQKNGIVLTKNTNTIGDFYKGVAILPEKDGGYCLHLCPVGGYGSFDRVQIDQLMTEAIEELVKQNIKITKITSFIGRHPGKTIDYFREWQADQLKKYHS